MVVESCASEKKTARHLPYKDANGKVDKPHLRNAAARANQINAVCGTESTASLRKRAVAKVKRLVAKHLGKETAEAALLTADDSVSVSIISSGT